MQWVSFGGDSVTAENVSARFGDELYTKEELLAEMGAAFLCAIAGIANERIDRNTTAYIQSWIAKLEEDNRLVLYAAAHVQKAVDCILGTPFEEFTETGVEREEAAKSSALSRSLHALGRLTCTSHA